MEHKCILCGKESLNTIMEIEGFPVAAQHIPSADELEADMGETLRLCQCRRCGLLQLDNAPVPYYKDVIRSGGFSKSMISSRNEQFKYFIDKCDLKGKKIVEVGCGATDTPATSRSVIYNLDGSSYAIKYDKSPDLIIVDTEVIFKSPLRFFISGIGDAITTKFEAEANNRKMRKNLIKGNYFSTYTGMVISDVCYDTLIGSGKDAVSGIQSGCHNESVDKVIEAVVLMSGLGAENCGCGIAHAVGEGIALVPTNKVSLHGEQVAFGLICQLIAEKRDVGVIRGLLKYYGEVGLPKTLGELGIDANDRNLGIIAGMAISRACWVEAIDVPVTTVWQVKGIIKQADDIGSGI